MSPETMVTIAVFVIGFFINYGVQKGVSDALRTEVAQLREDIRQIQLLLMKGK